MIQQAVELKNILTKELAVYEKLLAIAKDKTKLLVDRNLPELQSNLEEEENLVQQLVDFEPLRRDCVMAMVGEPSIRLELLVNRILDENLKSELISLGSRLREVVEEIRVINEGNQRLAQVGLEVAQQTIKIMTRAPKPVTYGPGGSGVSNQNQMRGRSLFDHKA